MTIAAVSVEPGQPDVDPDDPAWTRNPPSPEQRRADVLGAVVLFVGAVLSVVLGRTAGMYDEPASGAVSLAWLAAATLPLACRRRWPSFVLVVVAGAFVGAVTMQVPETLFLNIVLFTALYTVGAWERTRRRALLVRALVVTGMLGWLVVSLFQATTDPDVLEHFDNVGAFSPLVAYMLIQMLTNLLYFSGAWWFGDHAWSAARDRARMRRRTRELQAERARVEAQAVTIERLRLARELHDAVAHHVSVMGVQAAAARMLLPPGPGSERVAAALEQVEDSARDAIDELHGLVGTLRDDDQVHGLDEPVGSLAVTRLPELVAEVAGTGLTATYRVVGEPAPLPPVVSLNLYRIAQEALTNVRKHAGPDATADVRLRYLDDAVELEVADDGNGLRRTVLAGVGRTPAGGRASGGFGIVGMHERVAADGGVLTTGPRRAGGFVVRAHVPLRRPRESAPEATDV
ncbi:sensor histidine kinase [Cellulomonas soli]|uniref:sensor histidine kinase n=1 Tax=Cellulomonas soli TaxID=931535 RepID=UPI003F85DB77